MGAEELLRKTTRASWWGSVIAPEARVSGSHTTAGDRAQKRRRSRSTGPAPLAPLLDEACERLARGRAAFSIEDA